MAKVTIKDIATLAQTSKTTVSFYLNGKFEKMSQETRERIAKVIRETNYKPSALARSLNDKGSRLIGVLIGDITNTFSNQIVKGIEDVAHASGYQVIIGNSDYNSENEDRYIENMLSLGVDGFIIQPTASFRKYSRIINEERKPMVFFDSQLYEHKTSWVKANNYDAVYDATTSCLQKGYEDFIIITADTSLLSTRIERASGFRDALADAGIAHQTLIIEDKKDETEKIKAFLLHNIVPARKTLIFVPNCWALPMVFTTMKSLQIKMPEVGLIGFDNTEWTGLSSPTVSTIRQPAYEEGRQATKLLVGHIESGEVDERQKVLDCEINWQESTL
ncbi:LacI family DNA-binding transcriptional regulator [Streptococcus merionis]|uniref:LacI family DNA-binding transcriptional regulator n=1 Tax=Streptococcus merionis TaxID=400065 RepID=UPI0026EADB8E|nr:LacI family DNA-binding transcriptional regulator [Streptococcus merionis]